MTREQKIDFLQKVKKGNGKKLLSELAFEQSTNWVQLFNSMTIEQLEEFREIEIKKGLSTNPKDNEYLSGVIYLAYLNKVVIDRLPDFPNMNCEDIKKYLSIKLRCDFDNDTSLADDEVIFLGRMQWKKRDESCLPNFDHLSESEIDDCLNLIEQISDEYEDPNTQNL